MRKESDCDYDNWNRFVVICDTDIPYGQPSHSGDRKTFEVMTSTLPIGTLAIIYLIQCARCLSEINNLRHDQSQNTRNANDLNKRWRTPKGQPKQITQRNSQI